MDNGVTNSPARAPQRRVRRVLIATNHMRALAGSEVVTLELMEQMLAWGWSIDLFAHDLGGLVATEIAQIEREVRVIEGFRGATFADDYDLVWIQHSAVPRQLIDAWEQGGADYPVIWHHMSRFLPLEMPIVADVEERIASVSTGMCRRVLEVNREYGVARERQALLENPAPDAFADFERQPRSGALERVLVVSNHPPDEVRGAIALLRDRGVRCDLLGEVTRPRRVTPETLAGYDAIVTIGKTVQYGLSMGIPCYVYDHFGGPGWLTPDNLEPEAGWAFSGQLHGRTIDAATLADEIVDGFASARSWAQEHRAEHAERWRLSTTLASLVDDPRLRPVPRLTMAEARRLSAFAEFAGDMYRLHVSESTRLVALERELRATQSAVEAARAERDLAAGHLESLRRVLRMLGSRRWRATAVPRKIVASAKGVAPMEMSGVVDARAEDLDRIAEEMLRTRTFRLLDRNALRRLRR